MYPTCSSNPNMHQHNEPASSTPEIPGIITGQIEPSALYRGDTRNPAEIFPEGFRSRSNDMCIYSHLTWSMDLNQSSGYICTTYLKDYAKKFGTGEIGEAKTVFLYDINWPRSVETYTWADYQSFVDIPGSKIGDAYYVGEIYRNEIIIPLQIKKQDIRGAWPVDFVTEKISGSFIPNPNYIAPQQSNILRATRMIGHGLTGLGITLDSISLHHAYQISNETGNYHPFFREGSRIIGGWTGAAIGGYFSAKAATTACIPLALVYGPLAPPVCGFAGGVAGSVLGYLGVGELATRGYNSLIDAPNQVPPFLLPPGPVHFMSENRNQSITPAPALSLDAPGTQADINKYVDAIVRGTVSGLKNIVEMIKHPIDNILYPVSILAYDAIIIHTAQTFSPLNLVLQHYIQSNPHMYHDAVSRMEGRINNFKEAGVRFMEASGQQRAEVLAELATGVLVPGYFFQGMKYISAVARNSIANRIEFGTFSQPPHFNNVRTNEASRVPPNFETLTSSQIQSRSGVNNYLWVITTDNKLLIAAREVESVAHRLGLILPDGFKISQLHHHQLASLKPVLAAGELTTEGSLIKCITDLSGHYLPVGKHLPYLVERTFQRFGFKDATGKYQPYVPIAGLTPVETPHITFPTDSIPMNITPGIGSLATATAATGINFMAESSAQQSGSNPLNSAATTIAIAQAMTSGSCSDTPIENPAPAAGVNFMAESRTQQSGTNHLDSAATTIAIAQNLASAPAVTTTTDVQVTPAPTTVNFKAECQKRFQTHSYIAPPNPFNNCISNNSLFNSTFSPRVNSFNILTNPVPFTSSASAYFNNNLSSNLSNPLSLMSTASSYFGQQSNQWASDLRLSSQATWVLGKLENALRAYYGKIPYGAESIVTNILRREISASNLALGVSDFTIAIVFSGLLQSYKAQGLESNWEAPWSMLYCAKSFSWKYFEGKVGGVASDVAVITDLVDSATHAEAEDYFLCFPTCQLPASEAMIQQIKAEMADAYFNHNTLPFFSLHFNQQGMLYPIIHPAFEHTLTGNIIGMLDYWMKGFLNGGVFDEAFLQRWHESSNCDETLLRSMMIDLKKYCREKQIAYFSIRELESRYGLEQSHGSSAYSQPFMTSFRIISFQEKIERHGNVLVPSPTFRIEYTVDMMPDYKEHVEAHIREHGVYPPDHQKMLDCYELFAEEIKNTMPTLPFCRDYFQLLGLMSSLSYFYVTLDKMGKRPVINLPGNPTTYHFPKALPPIPVRYFRTYPLELNVETVLKKLTDSPEKKALFDKSFSKLFSEKSVLEFPADLLAPLQKDLEDLIRERMASSLSPTELQELNEEEIGKIARKIRQTIISVANSQFRTIHKMLDSTLTASRISIVSSRERRIKSSPLLLKMEQINRELKKHCERMTTHWEAHPHLAKDDAFLRAYIPPQLHPILKKEFKRIEKSLDNVVANLLELEIEIQRHGRAVIEKINADRSIINQHIMNDVRKCFADNQAIVDGISTMLDEYIFREEVDETYTMVDEFIFGEEKKPCTLENQKIAIINRGCKEVAVRLLNNYVQFMANVHKRSRDSLMHFSDTLLALPRLCHLPLAEVYTHAFIGFSGNALDEQTGERFKISGGCGLSMPAMKSSMLEHSAAFIEAMAQSSYEEGQDSAIFNHNGSQWVAHKIPVRDHLALSSEQTDQDVPKLVHAIQQVLANSPDTKDKPQYISTDIHGNHPIHLAAQDGDVDEMTRILADSPNEVHAKNSQDMTPLMAATQFNQLTAIQLLHAKGADFNYCSPNGLFPFYVAIERNFHAVASWMLENVSNLVLDQQLDTKVTPLHVAIHHESIELAKRLIEKGARCDIPRKSDGYTALHCAAIFGCVELLIAMRERGLALDTPLESKKTPLHLAAQAGEIKTVEYLLSQNSRPDAQTLEGDTALMLAIKAGQVEVACLLAQHTPINTRNTKQQSASLLALIYGMPVVADTLIARGEDPFLRDKQGENYLHYLVRNGEYQRFKRLRQTHEVDINQLTHGNSLLAVAAQHGHFLLVNTLQDAGADFISTSGKSLLDYAVQADDIGYLREHQGAHIPSKKLASLAARSNALHCLEWLLKTVSTSVAIIKNAIIGDHEKILSLLLKRCQQLDALVDDKGNSFLHFAVTNGSVHAVTQLLNLGSLPQKRNHDGDTAFHLAVKQQDTDMVKRLFKLSRPGDWPVDLWDLPVKKLAPGLMRVLHKYQKRLPAQSTASPATSHQTSLLTQQLNSTPMLTSLTREQLVTLKAHLAYSDFDAATTLLRESHDLLVLFQTAMGGKLLQQIIGNISDPNGLDDEPIAESSHAMKPIDDLLTFLRTQGVNPALHQGINNPLLILISAEKDCDACYQLDVFSRHFPDSIPLLAEDKALGNINLATLAIKRHKFALFEKLDAICRQQAQNTYNGLHESVCADNYVLTERMLRVYDVDRTNREGQTAFMIAAAKGNIPIINLLVRHGASPSARDIHGQHALHYALDGDDDKTALALLPLLEQPNLPNRFGVTPLMLAAEKGMVAVIRLLCDAGQYLKLHDKSGQNAMHYAARKGQAGSMDYLISIGFSCDEAEVPTNPGKAYRCLKRTPLHLTALNGHVEATLRLLELGADPLMADSQGNSLSEFAVRSKNKRVLNLTKLMPFYHQTERDSAVLHAAAQADNDEVVIELMMDGVDLNAVNKHGRSALHLAATHNAPAVLEILLDSPGVELNACDQWGNTALHYAAHHGYVRLVERLLQAGAKTDTQDEDGRTALWMACEQGQRGAVSALLKARVNTALLNSEGLSPVDIALKQGYIDIANQLKNKNGALHRFGFYPSPSKTSTEQIVTPNNHALV